jgi:hypothetical protein
MYLSVWFTNYHALQELWTYEQELDSRDDSEKVRVFVSSLEELGFTVMHAILEDTDDVTSVS